MNNKKEKSAFKKNLILIPGRIFQGVLVRRTRVDLIPIAIIIVLVIFLLVMVNYMVIVHGLREDRQIV